MADNYDETVNSSYDGSCTFDSSSNECSFNASASNGSAYDGSSNSRSSLESYADYEFSVVSMVDRSTQTPPQSCMCPGHYYYAPINDTDPALIVTVGGMASMGGASPFYQEGLPRQQSDSAVPNRSLESSSVDALETQETPQNDASSASTTGLASTGGASPINPVEEPPRQESDRAAPNTSTESSSVDAPETQGMPQNDVPSASTGGLASMEGDSPFYQDEPLRQDSDSAAPNPPSESASVDAPETQGMPQNDASSASTVGMASTEGASPINPVEEPPRQATTNPSATVDAPETVEVPENDAPRAPRRRFRLENILRDVQLENNAGSRLPNHGEEQGLAPEPANLPEGDFQHPEPGADQDGYLQHPEPGADQNGYFQHPVPGADPEGYFQHPEPGADPGGYFQHPEPGADPGGCFQHPEPGADPDGYLQHPEPGADQNGYFQHPVPGADPDGYFQHPEPGADPGGYFQHPEPGADPGGYSQHPEPGADQNGYFQHPEPEADPGGYLQYQGAYDAPQQPSNPSFEQEGSWGPEDVYPPDQCLDNIIFALAIILRYIISRDEARARRRRRRLLRFNAALGRANTAAPPAPNETLPPRYHAQNVEPNPRHGLPPQGRRYALDARNDALEQLANQRDMRSGDYRDLHRYVVDLHRRAREATAAFRANEANGPPMPAEANGPPMPAEGNGPPMMPVEANGSPMMPAEANGPPMPAEGNDPPMMPVEANGPPMMPVEANGPPMMPVEANGSPMMPAEANGPPMQVEANAPLMPAEGNGPPMMPEEEEEEEDSDSFSETSSLVDFVERHTTESVMDEPEPELECCICFGLVENGQMTRTLPCSHRMHRDCVDTWFRLRNATTCPLCRTEICRHRSSQ